MMGINAGVQAFAWRWMLLLAAATLLLLPRPAAAHPHVFIEVTPTVVFGKGRVVGILVEWAFDELFSAAVIRDFDVDRDKAFNAQELAQLKSGAFDNLKDYGYFTHFRVDGKQEPPKEVQDFSAAVEKGRLVYRFAIRPQRFIDPKRTPLDLLFYDESYYVDLRIREGAPIAMTGGEGCKAEIDKKPDLPDFGGMFLPELLHVDCG